MKTIGFEDQLFDYDETVADNWVFFRGTACGTEDPQAFFAAMDVLFGGDANAVAARLGNSTTKMMELFEAISEKLGDEQKN